ncbi:putative E3 ubiquitin-protein ligase LIN isoform X2 [Musa acuminata AAA Group]|uniref:putative E3 ubiquitin-protein ligase LIN isoform X2 n=1 Tax=Musa acuminata AAA Group TaxID=214697 RepID=UPI0031DAD405
MTVPSTAVVLRHTTAFLDEALSNPDLRHRIISSARRTVSSASPASLRALSLLSHALDSSPSAAASDAADKILLSVSGRNPLSALLLALAHALRGRAAAAALALLDLFSLDPALSRHEVAPEVFEALFLPHLLPVLHWFADQRSRILTTTSLRFGCPPAANDEGDDERSVEAVAAMSLLSRMSDGQAGRLKELERGYEEVLDANCKVYAEYLKEVVEMGDGGPLVLAPPQLVLTRASCEERRPDEVIEVEEELAARAAIGLRDGRYNPIWAEADQSVEFFIRQNSRVQVNDTKAPPSYPQRVSPDVLIRLPSSDHRTAEDNWVSTSGPYYSSDDNLDYSSSEIDFDIKERNTYTASLQTNGIQFQRHAQDSAESSCYPSPQIDDSDNIVAYNKQTPPKEFVCPITSNLFDDPVTLETGQTYERRAIKEWLDRGNSTCPITRQKLQSSQLPKTNYVLKRLIGSWVEENPYSTPNRLENSPPKIARDLNMSQSSPSLTSIIYQASVGGSASDLRLAISCLCTSEFLDESEKAVLQIEKLWRDTSPESEIIAMLAKPATVNGFIEILFKSVDLQVLRAAIFLLAELATKDKFVVQTLTRVDSDVKCMAALFKKGLVEAAVLIFLLSPRWESLVEMDMADALLRAIEKNDDELLEMCVNPKTASLLLLWQILREGNSDSSMILHSIISDGIIERVILSMEADMVEERIAAVGILIKCIAEDGRCRKIIADKAQLEPVLQSFAIVNDVDRFEIVHFLFELVKLNRRLSNEQLLHVIKGGGAFSMMHSLLVYLQTSSMDQSPVIAGLLLQLDLLVEPRKMSIYREEAVDTLISCLRNADFPRTQLKAAETILALQGRFSSSGRPLARALLLKHTGIRKGYRALKEAEQTRSASERTELNLEEEKAAEEWERKIAFALVSHEFGLVFEALSDGLKSRNLELSSACLISATWLSHMLSILPDTGVRGAARVCLLKQYILILKSARHTDDKALSMLALRSFMHDEEGLLNLTLHIKDILKTLRELKKSSGLAYEMLKLLSDGQDSSIKDMWIYKELMQVDCSTNGEVLSIVRFKNRIISGHLDGTIKVWKGDESILHLVHETNEHSKAVTSLAISQSGEKLYSGSLDKTVWAVHDGWIHCTETFDMKDPVRNLSVADTIVCFTPQGAGVKVLSWKGASKILSPNKNVRSLALVQGKLYCGCNDNSIQEIDLATETSATVLSGKKKLLGKDNPIYAVQVRDGLLYSAGTFLDGASVKVWSTSNYSLVGSIQSSIEVRSMAMSRELIYLGSKTGILEIWSKDKLTAIGSLQIGTNCKVQCMDVDADGEILVLGTSDGRLQAWGLT